VLPQGKTEATCSEELAFAYSSSEENGLEPKWISSEDVLKLKPVKTVECFCVATVTYTKDRYVCLRKKE
jgi:hypothetical protein